MTKAPTNWPFPIINGQRTPASKALLDKKRHVSNPAQERKEQLARTEDALL